MQEKYCPRCKQTKPVSEFNKNKKTISGYYAYCRLCQRAYKRNLYQQDINNERLKNRLRSMKNRYKLPLNGYDILLKRNGLRCWICKRKGEETLAKGRLLQVDHDHKTGRVRGILCNTCNLGLSKFSDDPKLIEAALKYLTKTLVFE